VYCATDLHAVGPYYTVYCSLCLWSYYRTNK